MTISRITLICFTIKRNNRLSTVTDSASEVVLEGFKKSREAMKEIRKVYEENKDKLQKEDNFELKVTKQQ